MASPPTLTIALLATLSLNLAAQTRLDPTVKYRDEKPGKQLYWHCIGTAHAPAHPNFGTGAQFIPWEDDFALSTHFGYAENIEVAQNDPLGAKKAARKASNTKRRCDPLNNINALLFAVATSAMAIFSLMRYGPRRVKTD